MIKPNASGVKLLDFKISFNMNVYTLYSATPYILYMSVCLSDRLELSISVYTSIHR